MKKILIPIIMSLSSQLTIANETKEVTNQFDFNNMTIEQQNSFNESIRKYLLSNPEILVEMSQSLNEKRMVEQTMKYSGDVIKNIDKLINVEDTPFYGPKDAEKIMVVFFDYNCIYCSKLVLDMKPIIEKNKDVKFIFKDMPILAREAPSSQYAAQTGIKVFKEKGSEAFLNYHNAVFDIGRESGVVDIKKVDDLVISMGVEPIKDSEYENVVKSSMALSRILRLVGTPGLVFLPSTNQTTENVFVIIKDLNQQEIQKEIDKLPSKKAI